MQACYREKGSKGHFTEAYSFNDFAENESNIKAHPGRIDPHTKFGEVDQEWFITIGPVPSKLAKELDGKDLEWQLILEDGCDWRIKRPMTPFVLWGYKEAMLIMRIYYDSLVEA